MGDGGASRNVNFDPQFITEMRDFGKDLTETRISALWRWDIVGNVGNVGIVGNEMKGGM